MHATQDGEGAGQLSCRTQLLNVPLTFLHLAEECHTPVDNYFVPIFVGMALAGLVVLVLMAYYVGRKNRHYTGYEQF